MVKEKIYGMSNFVDNLKKVVESIIVVTMILCFERGYI